MDDRYTILPQALQKILRDHNETAWRLSRFLKKSGAKVDPFYWLKEQFMRRTSLDLRIMHDNDYVEMGPHSDDPEGKLFTVFTTERLSLNFTPGKYYRVIKFLEDFSKKNVPENLRHVKLDFYSWQRKIKIPSMDNKNLSMPLVFSIYHRRTS